jgi:hypothetical protein
MQGLPEEIDGLPNLCGQEDLIASVTGAGRRPTVSRLEGGIDFAAIDGAFAIALHMHQPLIPAGGGDLRSAAMIGNLQYMLEHPDVGDNHNAPVFAWCYQRMGQYLPQLIQEGKQPRVMVEYSGELLHGLRQMGRGDVLDALQAVTCDPQTRHAIEWLGCPWGHAVAPSTPVQDYRLHVRAWQHHFAAIFGLEALARVRGFSPSEMALPNHPEVAHGFVKTLRECGYQWVLVQEHSVERRSTGGGAERPHLPHRLVCRNARGEEAAIIAIIKTQGSDTKLVGQMQPYYEAQGLGRAELGGKRVPPLVTQIADGENGGVMMNEFPSKYLAVVRECSGSAVPIVNVSEYLDSLFAGGLKEADLPALQPVHQQRIWDRFAPGDGPEKLEEVIAALRREDPPFHMEGGSWTNDRSWVRGYEGVLGPMEKVSALFAEQAARGGVSTTEHRYRNALFHLLASQTSCFRFWGEGTWTDYGREILRRAEKILEQEF